MGFDTENLEYHKKDPPPTSRCPSKRLIALPILAAILSVVYLIVLVPYFGIVKSTDFQLFRRSSFEFNITEQLHVLAIAEFDVCSVVRKTQDEQDRKWHLIQKNQTRLRDCDL